MKVAARAIKPNPPRPGPMVSSPVPMPEPTLTPGQSADVQREPLDSAVAPAQSASDGASVHTVQRGETLFAISQAYGVDV